MKEVIFPVADSDGNIFNKMDIGLSVIWLPFSGYSVESGKRYHLITIGAPGTAVADSDTEPYKMWISKKAMEYAPVGLVFSENIYALHPTWNTTALFLVEDRTETSSAAKGDNVIEKVQDYYGNLHSELDIARSLYSISVTKPGTSYEAEGVPTTLTVPDNENWAILRAEPEYPSSMGDEFLNLIYDTYTITISPYQNCFVPLKSGTTYSVYIATDVGNELYNLIILRDSRAANKGAYA